MRCRWKANDKYMTTTLEIHKWTSRKRKNIQDNKKTWCWPKHIHSTKCNNELAGELEKHKFLPDWVNGPLCRHTISLPLLPRSQIELINPFSFTNYIKIDLKMIDISKLIFQSCEGNYSGKQWLKEKYWQLIFAVNADLSVFSKGLQINNF